MLLTKLGIKSADTNDYYAYQVIYVGNMVCSSPGMNVVIKEFHI